MDRNFSQEKKGNTEITNTRNESNFTTGPTDIERVIKKHCE